MKNITIPILLVTMMCQACIPSIDNLPPPIVHTECLQKGRGCQPGYQCGPYGCARDRRLHGVTNWKQPDKGEGLSSIRSGMWKYMSMTASRPSTAAPAAPAASTATEVFYRCCENRQLPDECLEKCGFAHYNKQTIMSFVLRQSMCPIQALPVLHHCATQGVDHTRCCSRKRVPEQCLLFCGPPFDQKKVDHRHVACIEHLDTMKGCFYDDVQRKLSISKSASEGVDDIDLLQRHDDFKLL